MTLIKSLSTATIMIASASFALAEGITEQDVIDAQAAWGQGIVDIAKLHSDGGDFAGRAKEHLDVLYAYDSEKVMFKPTLASEDQFRETFDEALSYFIGTEGSEDKGFAIKGWTKVRFESNGIFTSGDAATAMGNYYFTGPDGTETKVEYSFGYVRGDDGALKINLHHSSLPYAPQ
ncbi:phosphoribosyl-AMP cyclohydrolase [Tropicibacter sp. R15_0]|uniref:phosphoribosyl-AMP cyclohydrolase n=1 Tax=Tropicibacter sp. R15_0 TaxID=2821101 RepID=UPI001AD99D46|nr:phosphoribosyl-AMP cyclohydrolase [Tropicibacter sp. R15_0]MBO9467111.1 phosphoribosyl-AMP cyclohydrolase [Tropicibacter sp. R15_0]